VSGGEISDLLREDYVKVRVKEVLEDLVVKMNRVLRGYLGAAQATIMRYYNIKPVMEVNSNIFEYGVEYHIRLYVDPEDVKKIEDMARRELEDKRARIRALRRIYAEELKEEEGQASEL
jgi:hypothetical protein